MTIKNLDISGFVKVYGDDVFLEPEHSDERYYYPKVKCIGEIVVDHFSKVTKATLKIAE